VKGRPKAVFVVIAISDGRRKTQDLRY